MPPTETAPLILTLALDEAAQAYFNDLRRRHFPPSINYLAAHLTLFHHLPGPELAAVSAALHRLSQAQRPLPLQVTGLRSLGRGVAFTLENPELRSLHRQLLAELQADFAPFGAVGTGLHLWAYRNGPWESVAEFAFEG